MAEATMKSLPDDALSSIVKCVALRYDDLLAASLISHEWRTACAPLLRQFQALIPTQPSTKVVLIGKPWSGRSTLLKHFVALHDGPLRLQFMMQKHLPIIRSKAVEAAWLLVEAIMENPIMRDRWHSACTRLDIDPNLGTTLNQMIDSCSVESAARDPVLAAHAIHKFSPKLVADVQQLWATYKDAHVDHQRVIPPGALPPDVVYMLDLGLERFVAPDYEPTLQDVLSVRVRTRGTAQHTFGFGEGHNLRLLDPSNLRHPRRRWMERFENCDMVVFVVALDLYDDQVDIFGDLSGEDTPLADALGIWERILQSFFMRAEEFDSTSFVLVLNRVDLFRAKLARVPFGAAWEGARQGRMAPSGAALPPYDGADDDADAIVAFIRDRFVQLAAGRRVATHVTCALDGESVRKLWPWGLLRDLAEHRAEHPLPHGPHAKPREVIHGMVHTIAPRRRRLGPRALLARALRPESGGRVREQNPGADPKPCACAIL